MKFEDYVVAKKDGQWLVGKIKGYEFTPYQEIKKLSDVKDVSSYITLTQYIKKNKLKPSLVKLLLSKTGLDSIYILNKPAYIDEEEWDKYWWKDFTAKCKGCEKDCKQSSYVIIVTCPDFKKTEK